MRYLLVFIAGCTISSPEPQTTVVETWHAPRPAPTAYRVVVKPPPMPKRLTREECEAKYADEMTQAALHEVEVYQREVDKIAAQCQPTQARNTVLFADGHRLEGATRQAWICNGVPVNQLPTPVGSFATETVRQKIKDCEERGR